MFCAFEVWVLERQRESQQHEQQRRGRGGRRQGRGRGGADDVEVGGPCQRRRQTAVHRESSTSGDGPRRQLS